MTDDGTIMLGRREYDRQLQLIDKKIDDLTENMLEISKTLQQLALQSYQIQSLQTAQTEMRNDISALNEKMSKIITDTTSCKTAFVAHKSSVTILWTVFSTLMLGIIGTYISHMINGVK